MPSEDDHKPATQADVAAAKLELKGDIAAVKGDIDRLDKKIDKVAAEMLRRIDGNASKADIAALDAKFNRVMDFLDKVNGDNIDNRRTLTVHDAALGDHRRRIEKLESKT